MTSSTSERNESLLKESRSVSEKYPCTNNEAEYMALNLGLELASTKFHIQNLEGIYSIYPIYSLISSLL